MMISPSGVIDSGTVAIVTYILSFVKFVVFIGVSFLILFLIQR